MSSFWLDYTRVLFGTCRAPAFGIGSIRVDGGCCPVTEAEIDRTPFCTLRRFAAVLPRAKSASGAPRDAREPRMAVMVCAPLAGHHAVMLRETVETLLPDAVVYITDWNDARDIPPGAGPLGLDDYVRTLERFMRRACSESGAPHVLAVCQAAPPALAAAALLTEAGDAPLASLTLMGGPVDARPHPGALARFARSHSPAWFRACAIDVVPAPYAGAGRRVYPGYLQQVAIVATHPERIGAMWLRYWVSGAIGVASGSMEPVAAAHRALDEYAAVLDMPEAYFLDTIRVVFQRALLPRGRWRVGGSLVRPSVLSATPLCTVEGDRDDITGAGQTHAAHALCGGTRDTPRVRLTIAGCDHYDLFTGPRWRDGIRPELLRFWRSAATALPEARKAGDAPRSTRRKPSRQPSTFTSPPCPASFAFPSR